MKKVFFCFMLVMTMAACSNDSQTWVYKVVKVAGKEADFLPDYGSLVYGDQTPMLNKMGADGWELVDIYTEVETKHPNFGNSEYVTGIRENTRTSVVNFVFKREATLKDDVAPATIKPKQPENKVKQDTIPAAKETK